MKTKSESGFVSRNGVKLEYKEKRSGNMITAANTMKAGVSNKTGAESLEIFIEGLPEIQ
jgi:hypothetical protein